MSCENESIEGHLLCFYEESVFFLRELSSKKSNVYLLNVFNILSPPGFLVRDFLI